MISTEQNHDSTAQELVAFRIGDQEYCVNIMTVREIRGWTPETALPHAPDFVRGVINLRGSVVPIVDLAARLGIETSQPSSRHVIMIAQIGAHVVGLLVDAVSDILTIDRESIQPTPEIASDQVKQFIAGVITLEGRMIRLLEINEALPASTARELAA